MHTPFILQVRSPQTPWEVFQRLYRNSRTCFFLDSHRYASPDQGFSYMGGDPFLEVTVKDGKIFLTGEIKAVYPAKKLLTLLRRLFDNYRSAARANHSFFTGGAVGYWGYELAELFEKVKFRAKRCEGIPDLALGFYRDVIIYDHRRKIYLLAVNIYSTKNLSFPDLRRRVREPLSRLKCFLGDGKAPSFAGDFSRNGFHLKNFRPEITRKRFEKAVRRAQAYIRTGDIYQANLSQRFRFQFRGSSLKLYDRLRRINPSPFASFLKSGDMEILSSSPERLVRKRGSLCETVPIAGTRPRREAEKRENDLVRELFSNPKERAEHIMLVDLERNDLGRVCEWPSVRVEKMMDIQKYSHVIHLVSKITGRLEKGKDAFDLIRAMFPGGTITGCPKVRCMEIIDELERSRRGIYTGSIGYVDYRGDLDLNIVIRTLILRKGKGILQAGAGIVFDSDPGREYEETLHKGEALAEALVQASVQ